MLRLWFNSDLLYLNYVFLGTGCYNIEQEQPDIEEAQQQDDTEQPHQHDGGVRF